MLADRPCLSDHLCPPSLSSFTAHVHVLFRELAELARRIASTSSRREKVAIVAELIRKLDPEEAYKALLILTGRIFPPSDPRELNVSWATLWKVVSELTRRGEPKGVDVGELVESMLKSRDKRQTILFEEPLTIEEVYSLLEAIAEAEGPGSKGKKESILKTLFSRMEPEEAWLLANAIIGETRLGLSEGLLIDAIAHAYRRRREDVERATMVLGDPYEIVRRGGRLEFKPVVFRPLRPMLAQRAEGVRAAITELGKCALEYKLDGIRVQVHVKGEEVRLFSRRLSDVTRSVPDVVESVRSGVRAEEAILEGEIIAERDGRPLPFQMLIRRFRRTNFDPKLLEEIPLRLYLFDLLLLNGESYLERPYVERRAKLEQVVSEPLRLVQSIVTSNPREGERFMKEALERGHEGIMAKRLDSPYVPGVRGRFWLKVKEVHTLDLVVVAAERGYGRRHRWYSDYYLAVRDPETGEFLVVGKTFKGLTDEEFEWMTRRLEELAVEREGKLIRVRPEIVVEVAFNELQRSSKYRSGFALRFARILRIRDDKAPDEVDTLDKVRELYEKQGRKL